MFVLGLLLALMVIRPAPFGGVTTAQAAEETLFSSSFGAATTNDIGTIPGEGWIDGDGSGAFVSTVDTTGILPRPGGATPLALILPPDAGSLDFAARKAISTEGFSDVKISLWCWIIELDDSADLILEVSSNGGGSWTEAGRWSVGGADCPSFSSWEKLEADLPSSADDNEDFEFRLRRAPGPIIMFIDDLVVTGEPVLSDDEMLFSSSFGNVNFAEDSRLNDIGFILNHVTGQNEGWVDGDILGMGTSHVRVGRDLVRAGGPTIEALEIGPESANRPFSAKKALSTAGFNDIKLSFWCGSVGLGTDPRAELILEVSLNGGDSWQEAGRWTAPDNAGCSGVNFGNPWSFREVDLPVADNNADFQFRFRRANISATVLLVVDDLAVTGEPMDPGTVAGGCKGLATQTPTFTDITQTSVLVNWNDTCTDEAFWRVFRDGDLAFGYGQDREAHLDDDLTCGTTYEYFVLALDADHAVEATSATGQATTLPCTPIDTDGDGVSDDVDNCDRAPNPGQQDTNNNGIGDACDTTGLTIPTACAGITIDAVFIGTNGNNTLEGTPFNDLIIGLGGNDKIDGLGGHNCIDGGNGNDTITAGDGNDVILGGSGNDDIDAGDGDNTVSGGNGNDDIVTRDGADEIDAGGGNNKIDAGDGANIITSGNGNDEVRTGIGKDVIDAGGGNNVIESGGGGDQIETANGNDVICTGTFASFGNLDTCAGSADADEINAGGGNNKIDAGDGDNIVTTENGNDQIVAGNGDDQINAGGGNNKIDAGGGANVVTTANGNDDIVTGNGNDEINAGGGNNKIDAGDGADTVVTANGNDNVDCGAGTDSASVGGGNNTNAGNRCETFVP